tara:strand:- start:486 stop:644 length:159 start_codon:yes stop_codon:yes gene_type:complete
MADINTINNAEDTTTRGKSLNTGGMRKKYANKKKKKDSIDFRIVKTKYVAGK